MTNDRLTPPALALRSFDIGIGQLIAHWYEYTCVNRCMCGCLSVRPSFFISRPWLSSCEWIFVNVSAFALIPTFSLLTVIVFDVVCVVPCYYFFLLVIPLFYSENMSVNCVLILLAPSFLIHTCVWGIDHPFIHSCEHSNKQTYVGYLVCWFSRATICPSVRPSIQFVVVGSVLSFFFNICFAIAHLGFLVPQYVGRCQCVCSTKAKKENCCHKWKYNSDQMRKNNDWPTEWWKCVSCWLPLLGL